MPGLIRIYVIRHDFSKGLMVEDGWGRIVDGGDCKNVAPKAGRDKKWTQKRHSPFIKHGGLEGDDDLSQLCWRVLL